MFIDSARIEIEAGVGGNGIVAFRRESFVEMGGPYGGSGGRGANIVFEVDEGLRTLLDFSYKKKYIGEAGENGRNKSQHGHAAKDVILKVPPGTVLINDTTNEFICDLIHHGEKKIIAKGGRGGRGNFALAKAGRHALEICENGEPGEFLNLRLELKLLADVGLVGLPSVGKSSLISVMSSVRPKIAQYHFTTLVPNLGVSKTNDGRSFVIADLPGLIEGAAQGKGLGHQFLKHIERTKIILHIIDMGSFEGRNPIIDYDIINKELVEYGFDLESRKQIVLANKMDLPNAKENLEQFKISYSNVEIIPVSAITKEGIDLVILKVADLLDEIGNIFHISEQPKRKLYKFEYDNGIDIYRDEAGDINIRGFEIERLVKMTNFNTFDNIRRFANTLKTMGVYDLLEEFGVEPGELIIVMDYEFQYDQ